MQGQKNIKVPSIKFDGNSCSGNCTDSCGQTGRRTDKTTHMTRLIDGFHDYANVPKIICFLSFLLVAPYKDVSVGMYIARQKQGYRHCSVLC